jgi:hypothetical protein
MFDPKLEDLAKCVRRNADAEILPVNLVKIADYDGIILQPVTEHSRFNGKIEFLADENVFVIYHPDPATYRFPSRLRFSIAHEIAHFHIDDHRDALIRGESHSSESGFRSKHPKEIQADEFAAALLIPAHLMEPQIEKRGFMSLEEIRKVAQACEVSPYATTIRYVRMAAEVCLVVLAQNGVIKSSFSSDEAKIKRFGKLSIQSLPEMSPGIALAACVRSDEIREHEHAVSAWFARDDDFKVWESCFQIGEGYTLSLISVDDGAP